MALPTIQISPVGAGTVSAAPLYSYTGTPSITDRHTFHEGDDTLDFYTTQGYYYEIAFYKLTATAAAGYVFDHFEISYRETDNYGTDLQGTPNNTNNPAISNGRGTGSQWGAGIGDLYLSIHNSWSRLETTAIVAVFRLAHTPTHLLVNSYNRSSPVQLVHDPASNLLISDH